MTTTRPNLVDSINIKLLTSVLPQPDRLCSAGSFNVQDTIFNNIAYSNPSATVEEVITRRMLQTPIPIAKLPDGYDTMLGERGWGLRRRKTTSFNCPRQFSKPVNPIFDEATAAVDSETGAYQTAIERLIRGRTTLMIAHRLSTLRKANKIIVVDKGEVRCGSTRSLWLSGNTISSSKSKACPRKSGRTKKPKF